MALNLGGFSGGFARTGFSVGAEAPVYRPAYELAARVVELLRDDANLTALLFPAWQPVIGPADMRVYEARADLPPDPAIRGAYPRIYVSAQGGRLDAEQSVMDLWNEEVTFRIHVLVPAGHLRHGEAIVARAFYVVGSSAMSTSRILVSEASWEGGMTSQRETGDVHRLTLGPWRCRLVGVRT